MFLSQYISGDTGVFSLGACLAQDGEISKGKESALVTLCTSNLVVPTQLELNEYLLTE